MATRQLGLVVHPRRHIDQALQTVRGWATEHEAAVGQVRISGQEREVAEPVDVASCDLVVSLGGDGTTLAALHAAAPASRPVLGAACGSIGVLTAVDADRLSWALDQVAAGQWTPRKLPALEIATETGDMGLALNDFVAIRDGAGQVINAIKVDGELYGRTAGDGVLIATPLGSTAYTMAAGGPILGPGAEGMVVVALAHHGGLVPPLVVGPNSRLEMSVKPGFGGARFEVDGQTLPTGAADVTITLRPNYATLVRLAGDEPLLTSLRRRGLVLDSARILARDARVVPPPGL